HPCGARLVLIALHGRPKHIRLGALRSLDDGCKIAMSALEARVIASFHGAVKGSSENVAKHPCDRTQNAGPPNEIRMSGSSVAGPGLACTGRGAPDRPCCTSSSSADTPRRRTETLTRQETVRRWPATSARHSHPRPETCPDCASARTHP